MTIAYQALSSNFDIFLFIAYLRDVDTQFIYHDVEG